MIDPVENIGSLDLFNKEQSFNLNKNCKFIPSNSPKIVGKEIKSIKEFTNRKRKYNELEYSNKDKAENFVFQVKRFKSLTLNDEIKNEDKMEIID